MHGTAAARALLPDLRTSGGRRCIRPACGAWSIRTPDRLSYALDQHVWTCAVGHRTPDGVLEQPGEGIDPASTAVVAQERRGARAVPAPEQFAAAGRSIVREADVGLVEFLHVVVETCTALIGADGGSIVLTAPAGQVHATSAGAEDADLDELIRISDAEGPGLLCTTTVRSVDVPDLERVLGRWPVFARAALDRGIRAVHATPLRLQASAVGCMTFLFRDVGALGPDAAAGLRVLAEDAMAAAAGAHLVRAVHEHLREALDTRALIEQATGVLMAVHGISAGVAHARMSAHAELERLTVTAVARAVVARSLELPLSGHWGRTETRAPDRDLLGVLLGAHASGSAASGPLVDRDIGRLLEQAAAVHEAAGRTALARNHRAAAAAIRSS